MTSLRDDLPAVAPQGQPQDHGKEQPAEPSATGPIAAALAALVAMVALVWVVVFYPRPESELIDFASLGLHVNAVPAEEPGDLPEIAVAHDPARVGEYMDGWQGPLGGTLQPPTVHADGSWASVVTGGHPGGIITMRADPQAAVGVVTWTGRSLEPEAFDRCALPRAVPLERLADLAPVEATVDPQSVTGACTTEGAVLYVPLISDMVSEVSTLTRLLGARPETATVPAGVVVVGPDGEPTYVEELAGEDTAATAVLPRAVAREAFDHALPTNSLLDAGTFLSPRYPVLAPSAGRLWWVLPVSPLQNGGVVTGYALMAADRVVSGRYNEIAVHWLPQPTQGADQLIQRARDLLGQVAAEQDEDYSDALVVLTLPDLQGAWHGHVERPTQLSTTASAVLFFVDANPQGRICLTDPSGDRVACDDAAANRVFP